MLMLVVALILLLAVLFSMLGLGGAMLFVPLLKWFGYDFKSVAIPTALLLNGVTALSAAVTYLRSGMVDVRGSWPMIVTSLAGAPVGALLTGHVPTRILIALFAAAMVLAGGRMLLSAGGREPEQMMPATRRMLLTGAAGFGIGFIAGLLGVGGGFLIVPLLIALGYPTKRAAATSAFVVVFSSFSGFLGHVAGGHFEPRLMILSLTAVIIGSQAGAVIMRDRMRPRRLKQMFGVVLLGVAVKLALGLPA